MTGSRKKIPVSQLEIGMHIHSIAGSWLSHSLWRNDIAVTDADVLRKVRESGARECWVEERPRSRSAASPGPAMEPTPNTPVARKAMPVRDDAADEMIEASRLLDRSRVIARQLFDDARMGRAIDANACAALVEDIRSSVDRHAHAFVSLVRLKRADEYTYMHSVAVGALMIALSRQLRLDDAECRAAGMAGLLHDVGKARMPVEILTKPGKLEDEEWDVMRSHPLHGHDLLLATGIDDAAALTVCRNHHERFDGNGYPDRLAGTQIPLLARMGAVCDVYDAVTSERPYKAAWSPADALSRMATWSGHFDKDILHAFVRTVGIYPCGSLVRLGSGRLGVVVKQHPTMLTAPVIKVFFSTGANLQLPPVLVDLAAPGCRERIIGREAPENWCFPNLDSLWCKEK